MNDIALESKMRLSPAHTQSLAHTLRARAEPWDYVTEEYKNYLRDEKVVLVGGSDVFETPSRRGSIWVRVNNHWRRQGGACDVLYHTVTGEAGFADEVLSPYTEFMWLNRVDGDYDHGHISRPAYADVIEKARTAGTKNIGFFAQGQWQGENPFGPEYEWLNILHHHFDCKLFTGMVALAHLLRQPCASVLVTGMDMFVRETGADAEAKRHSHTLRGNLEFLAAITKRDSRVVLDLRLQQALTDYGYGI